MSATTTESRGGLRSRLRSRGDYDFIGRSRTWLLVSLALVAVSLLGLAVRGLNFGLDFTGGTAIVVTGATSDFDSAEVREALAAEGVQESVVQVSEGAEGRGALIRTSSLEEIGGGQQDAVLQTVASITGAPREAIDIDAVGPQWGVQITRQALEGLGAFLLLVVAYIALRFEWRMAVAALVTLVHDVVVTIGIYALIGFEVTPASVIALLTILGYSLYDTVVVFDRVKENASRLTSVSTQSYAGMANSALNQVLLRSLSTSLTSLLPVGSLLFIGANLLGADTLQDLALALFVGMGVGTYSSIFVATPILVWLKEKEPRYAKLKERAASRR
ncbi:MAG: protein translocase subunit SecF [Nitriliruptorales bacterium]|nr:protein translocase subunit SecF [Nitriliruptorales bacterium]